jgi:hypothetical protein
MGRIKKLIEGRAYEIIWVDNNVPDQESGWLEKDYCKEFSRDNSSAVVRSCGFLFAQDGTFLTLVGDCDIGEVQATMRLIKIFKPCIVSIAELTPKIFYKSKGLTHAIEKA